MNITEVIQVYLRETTPADGRWLFIDGDPTVGVTFNLTGRSLTLEVAELERLRVIVTHLLDAEEVTAASLLEALGETPPSP